MVAEPSIDNPARIYLDNAATSWPKPAAVYDAVDRYQRLSGAAAGRSQYAEASEVSRLVEDARQRLANLIGAREANRVIFTFNGTDSLNLSLLGLLRLGDHVVTSVVEHNSTLRPLRHLEEMGTIQVAYVPCDQQGLVDPDQFRRAIRPATRLFALVHASNVTGAIQPVDEVAQIVREHGILMLVDAAQSLGHIPLDVQQLPCDLLASSAHKGLLGPLGTGMVYLAPGAEHHVSSFRWGGTGTQSQHDRQPESLPDKYESGNLNVPGLVGLRAALEYLQQRGIPSVRQHEQALTGHLLEALRNLAGVTVHGPADAGRQVGVVSVTVRGYDPQEVAAILDVAAGIQVRSGLHCAPRMHQALGTAPHGGTVRFSFGPFNNPVHVERAIRAIAHVCAGSSNVT